jgi:hypothetical protein
MSVPFLDIPVFFFLDNSSFNFDFKFGGRIVELVCREVFFFLDNSSFNFDFKFGGANC